MALITEADNITQSVETPERITFKSIALPMAAMGVPVIRLQPRSKIPMDKKWQDLATTDVDTILAWDSETPGAGAACVAKSDGVLFFETDEPNVIGRYEQETGETLPETFAVQSREDRYHFYFLQTDESRKCGSITQKEIPFGSLRQNNAYVVASGSIHPTTGLPYITLNDSPIVPVPLKLLEWLQAQRKKAAPVSSAFSETARVPRGQHDVTLTHYAGVLRDKGLNAEEMEPVLIRYVEEKFDNYGSDYREMVRKVARSISKKPAGDPTPTVLIGGKLPGEAVASAAAPTPPEPLIDTSEGSLRPVFPHHVMEGTTLYEGLVKPAVDNSSKHAEFVFVPAVQMMLNYLSGKVRIAMQETNLNLFVGLVSPPGEFFKSSSCALSHDYFKSMGLSAKYSKSLPNADGRVIVMQTGSSEGFGLTMSEINGKNAILFNDELGKLVAKAGIENSSLPHDLLTWYESGDFGNTVKSRKDSFAFEGKSYTFGWQWCTTTRGFNRHWPKIAGAVSGMEDRMFFVVSPEKPKPAGAYRVPPIEEAAKVTYSAIEAATLKGVYEFAVWEDVNSIANGMNPRTMQMLFALALYFAIDLKRDKIDLDCLTRAKELVAFRDQSIRFLAPIEADNEQGRVQQEITRELRQNKGKMKTRDLSKELHAERYGTDRWKAAYWGLVKEGVIADFSEKSKSGQTCRMTALLVPND
jgi:hypothetical protein